MYSFIPLNRRERGDADCHSGAGWCRAVTVHINKKKRVQRRRYRFAEKVREGMRLISSPSLPLTYIAAKQENTQWNRPETTTTHIRNDRMKFFFSDVGGLRTAKDDGGGWSALRRKSFFSKKPSGSLPG